MMKKIVCIAALLFSFYHFGVAQEDIRFGFQLSPTFSWMTTNDNKINPSGTNLGLKLGMIGEFFFRENYAFTTGLGIGFNQGGTLQHEYSGFYWTESDISPAPDSLPSGVKLKYGIQFVEIPLGLKMRTREFGYIRYYLEPAFALAFRSQARGSITGINIGDNVEKINIRQEVNLLNISWGIGGGLEYSVSENTILIGGFAFQTGTLDSTADNGTTFDPDRGRKDEDSRGTANYITLRIAVMF